MLFALALFAGHRIFFALVRHLHLLSSKQIYYPITITLNMADDDVATKAPESDAKEPSIMSSEDTPAQKGASMGVRYIALIN